MTYDNWIDRRIHGSWIRFQMCALRTPPLAKAFFRSHPRCLDAWLSGIASCPFSASPKCFLQSFRGQVRPHPLRTIIYSLLWLHIGYSKIYVLAGIHFGISIPNFYQKEYFAIFEKYEDFQSYPTTPNSTPNTSVFLSVFRFFRCFQETRWFVFSPRHWNDFFTSVTKALWVCLLD